MNCDIKDAMDLHSVKLSANSKLVKACSKFGLAKLMILNEALTYSKNTLAY